MEQSQRGIYYELTGNLPKCVGVERLCEGTNIQIPFNADEINLIYQFGEQGKSETCAELTAITKRRKLTERDHSIKTRLAKAKERGIKNGIVCVFVLKYPYRI